MAAPVLVIVVVAALVSWEGRVDAHNRIMKPHPTVHTDQYADKQQEKMAPVPTPTNSKMAAAHSTTPITCACPADNRNKKQCICPRGGSTGRGSTPARSAWVTRATALLFTVGNCVSMAALITTFITFALVPRMRDVAGKSLMFLMATLFMAKLAFEVNPLLRGTHLCTAGAIVQHYFCLSAFLWMSVLAYDIFLVVVGSEWRRSSIILTYMIYALGVPLSLVVSCAVVESFSDVGFSYGSPVRCGVLGDDALLYSLAVPLAAISLFNTTFFLVTVIQMNCSMSYMGGRGADARMRVRDRRTLMTYFKMSTLMSLAWLSGFTAAFSGIYELWLLFIVLNMFQGIYMFLAFSVKCQRVCNYVSCTFSCCSWKENKPPATATVEAPESVDEDTEVSVISNGVVVYNTRL